MPIPTAILELVARGDVQFGKIGRAVVGQRMTLEPGPEIFHRIKVGCVRWQERDLDMPLQIVQIVAHQATSMRLQSIPDNKQWLFQVGLERLEEFDDLLLLDAAFVQPEHAVGACQPCNGRNMVPVEVKLDDRGLPLEAPCAYPRGTLAETRLVDEDDQASFSLGFF